MAGNETQPIDPATCTGEWYLVSVAGSKPCPAYRWPDSARWEAWGGDTLYLDSDIAVLAELVRQDEAQKVSEWLLARQSWSFEPEEYDLRMLLRRSRFDLCTAEDAHDEMRAARDRWRAECEKAQAERDEIVEQVEQLGAEYRDIKAERDELQRCNERQKSGLRQMGEELGEARDERDKYMAALKLAEQLPYERFEVTVGSRGEAPYVDIVMRNGTRVVGHVDAAWDGGKRPPPEPDADPTSASRLRLAAETIAARSRAEFGHLDASYCAGTLWDAAVKAEAVAAREQDPDLCRQCLKCGLETEPHRMEIWRDADGSGHWIHPWCRKDVDFDPTNPDDLDQLANCLEAVNRVASSREPDDKRCPSGLRAKAELLRREAAREQERDAEINAVKAAIDDIGITDEAAARIIRTLDAHRNERGQ